MNMIFIRGIALPGSVRGVTVKDKDDNFNIYVNTNLNPEQQQKAIAHELKHINAGHFHKELSAAQSEQEVFAQQETLQVHELLHGQAFLAE